MVPCCPGPDLLLGLWPCFAPGAPWLGVSWLSAVLEVPLTHHAWQPACKTLEMVQSHGSVLGAGDAMSPLAPEPL